MIPKQRSIAMSVIFTILTCGIYGLYWMVVLNDELLDELGEPGTSGVMVILYTILTCGIYGIYWAYQMGCRIDRLNSRYDRYTDNTGLLYLLLQLLGFSIVVLAVAQNEMNNYYRFYYHN